MGFLWGQNKPEGMLPWAHKAQD